MSTFREREERGLYINLHSYEKDKEAYQRREAQIISQVQIDLERECGVEGHPKADLLWKLCWDEGHSGGFGEIANLYYDFVGLLK